MFPKKPNKIKPVYLDNAAATPTDLTVVKAMKKAGYYNPSALYAGAVKEREKIDRARYEVAQVLGTQPDTIIFTGSGTESINLALLGTARKHKAQGRHIITTKVEHHAVLHTMQKLEAEGFRVTYLGVGQAGNIDRADFNQALRRDTILVSIMYANNEIGNIYPIADIGREILKWRKRNKTKYPYFHGDACQAGTLNLDTRKLHVDLLTLNGSKIYGPKGVGVFYKRRGVIIEPIMYGGGQEYGLRPGTENSAAILGLARALHLIQKNKNKINKQTAKLRNYFWRELRKRLPDIRLVGADLDSGERLDNHLSIVFPGVEAETLLLYLDSFGIMASSGSACALDTDEVSHVLIACGLKPSLARSAVRFTLGKDTKKSEIDYVLKYLPKIVMALRN